jgi:hypothetical protein
MRLRVTATIAIVVFAAALCVGTSGAARADGLVANWVLGDAGASGTLANGQSIADSGPNGYTGTAVLASGDAITGMAGEIGNGLYFSGAELDSYLSMPYDSTGTSLGSYSLSQRTGALTYSVWVNIPAQSYNTVTKVAVSLPGDYYLDTYAGLSRYELGFSFNNNPVAYDAYLPDPSGNKTFGLRTDGSGWVANTWELLTVRYWEGNVGQDQSVADIYVNGKYVGFGSWMNGIGNFVAPLAVATSNLTIGNVSGGAQDWYGGLNDIGVWHTDLTGPFDLTTLNEGTEGAEGGEVSALYNTPMYNGHSGPLSQYGVSAMDKLFTLYDGQLTAPAGVTTANGTLGWQYVAGGLPGTSGYAGQIAGGPYYVQLDANGGGVETVLPGNAIGLGDATVDINDLTIVLGHYGMTGMVWSQGEFTGSGTVDINDLTIVLTNYGDSYSAAAGGPGAVPEPSTLLLISGALAGMLAFAWRRPK